MTLPELERLAREATPGPWKTEFLNKDAQRLGMFVYVPYRGAICACPKDSDQFSAHKYNMAYIAAMSPDACLALIERVRKAEGVIAAERERCAKVADACRVRAERIKTVVPEINLLHAQAVSVASEIAAAIRALPTNEALDDKHDDDAELAPEERATQILVWLYGEHDPDATKEVHAYIAAQISAALAARDAEVERLKGALDAMTINVESVIKRSDKWQAQCQTADDVNAALRAQVEQLLAALREIGPELPERMGFVSLAATAKEPHICAVSDAERDAAERAARLMELNGQYERAEQIRALPTKEAPDDEARKIVGNLQALGYLGDDHVVSVTMIIRDALAARDAEIERLTADSEGRGDALASTESQVAELTGERDALRAQVAQMREVLKYLPVDEQGCFTLPDGSCVSIGPCPHKAKEPQS